MPRGFRGGSQGKMPAPKKAVQIKNVQKVGPSPKGPVAGGMPGRPKGESAPTFGKPRGSMKECW